MNNVTRVIGVCAVDFAVASGAAYADSGKTREQVQAQLVAAWKAGNVPLGEAGMPPPRDVPRTVPGGPRGFAGQDARTGTCGTGRGHSCRGGAADRPCHCPRGLPGGVPDG